MASRKTVGFPLHVSARRARRSVPLECPLRLSLRTALSSPKEGPNAWSTNAEIFAKNESNAVSAQTKNAIVVAQLLSSMRLKSRRAQRRIAIDAIRTAGVRFLRNSRKAARPGPRMCMSSSLCRSEQLHVQRAQQRVQEASSGDALTGPARQARLIFRAELETGRRGLRQVRRPLSPCTPSSDAGSPDGCRRCKHWLSKRKATGRRMWEFDETRHRR